jgi:peptidoglycan/xylan/chitin deacetylase (PgdA/CDA1 family)
MDWKRMPVRHVLKTSFVTLLKALSCPLYGIFRLKYHLRPDDKIPILVYHKISDLTEGLDAFWNVPPSLFAHHMAYISGEGYSVLSLQEFYEYTRQGQEPAQRSVVVTFDDGYASVYKHAYPILKKYNFPATIFLTAGYTGNRHIYWWDQPLLKKRPEVREEVRLLSWEEIEEMQASGLVTFGSHSMSHPHLGELQKTIIEYELEQSKKVLENRLKQPVTFFAYPFGMKSYGDISDQTAELLAEKGYELACTSETGRNSLHENIYMLKRIGLGHDDSINLFRAKLTGAYDWVGLAQKTFQRTFKNIS